MVKDKILRNRREVTNTIRISNRNPDCLKINSSETKEHQKRKFQIFQYLRNQNKLVFTECIFQNMSGRADLIDSDEKIIYEIFNTEEEASLLRKKKDYPFEVRFISALEPFTEKMLL